VSNTELLSYLVCFLLGTQTRILFYLSSPPGYELSTASHSCTDAWKFERSYLEATGSGLVTYAISSFLIRVDVAFVMQLHKNPPFLYKSFSARCRENTVFTGRSGVVKFVRSTGLIGSLRACLYTLEMKKNLTYTGNRILDCAVRDLASTPKALFRFCVMTS
jgi:hypothetical protein